MEAVVGFFDFAAGAAKTAKDGPQRHGCKGTLEKARTVTRRVDCMQEKHKKESEEEEEYKVREGEQQYR